MVEPDPVTTPVLMRCISFVVRERLYDGAVVTTELADCFAEYRGNHWIVDAGASPPRAFHLRTIERLEIHFYPPIDGPLDGEDM
jgi:hypothetical protein